MSHVKRKPLKNYRKWAWSKSREPLKSQKVFSSFLNPSPLVKTETSRTRKLGVIYPRFPRFFMFPSF